MKEAAEFSLGSRFDLVCDLRRVKSTGSLTRGEPESAIRGIRLRLIEIAMALPLKDFRLGITESIDLWLESESRARRVDKALIAREVLVEWANVRARAFKFARRQMAGNGIQPELFGDDAEDDGEETADAGMRRNGKK